MTAADRKSAHPASAVGVVVPAAGMGSRMGGRRKAWLEAAGEPLLLRALRPFLSHPDVTALSVVLAAEDAVAPPKWLEGLDERIRIVPGGEHRTESVRRGIEALPAELGVIVVHDAARPLLAPEVLERCLAVARAGRGAVAGWPAVDTLKEVSEGLEITGTPERSRIWHAQTPQAFPAALLRRAYEAVDDPSAFTDDASVVEAVGGTVAMVDGARWNLKVTRPEDLVVVEALLSHGSGSGGDVT